MLEVLIAIVALTVGFVGGVYLRRSAVADFERGVQLGLSQLGTLVKSQANVQQPRHDSPKPQNNGPQNKN